LFNCRNDADQRAIIQAISRAAIYASSHGVVMIAAAGNEGIDLNHPVTDTISPDFPPNSEQARDVGNYCVVLPQEIPGVAAVSAIGPKGILSFYSTYGNFVAVTAPGGSSLQAPNPFGRVLNAWSSTAPPTAGGNETRTVEDCSGGPCVRWAWVQGTSMASPHAAGVAALILSAHPNLAPGAVIARLGTTAMPMECPEVQDVAPPDFPEKTCTGGGTHTTFYGSGLVDALAAGA
jgi:subtilisin family serine protease